MSLGPSRPPYGLPSQRTMGSRRTRRTVVAVIAVLIIAVLLLVFLVLVPGAHRASIGDRYLSAYDSAFKRLSAATQRIQADGPGKAAALQADFREVAAALNDFDAAMRAIDFDGFSDKAQAVIRDTDALRDEWQAASAEPAHADVKRLDADSTTWDSDNVALASTLGVTLPEATPAPAPGG